MDSHVRVAEPVSLILLEQDDGAENVIGPRQTAYVSDGRIDSAAVCRGTQNGCPLRRRRRMLHCALLVAVAERIRDGRRSNRPPLKRTGNRDRSLPRHQATQFPRPTRRPGTGRREEPRCASVSPPAPSGSPPPPSCRRPARSSACWCVLCHGGTILIKRRSSRQSASIRQPALLR